MIDELEDLRDSDGRQGEVAPLGVSKADSAEADFAIRGLPACSREDMPGATPLLDASELRR